MKDLYNLKVASVESEFRVVLNAGEVDGMRTGMTFVIFELGDDIIDPDTGDSLGQLERVKGKIEITHVQEKMSVGISSDFTKQRIPVPARNALSGGLFGSTEYEERQIRKKLSDPQIGNLARRTS
ncbi:hypothetical protein D3C85_972500 [compost metagenome]